MYGGAQAEEPDDVELAAEDQADQEIRQARPA